MLLHALCVPVYARRRRKTITQLLLIMNITALFLLAACLTASAAGFTQKVTLNEKNAPLQKIFRQINKQTGYQFFYKDELLQKAGKLDINVQDAPLEEVLHDCFKNLPISYSISGKTILISEIEEKKTVVEKLDKINDVITGVIHDVDGKPIAGVNVLVKGTNKGTTTDANGKFSIDATAGDVLVISSVGYGAREIKISGKNVINIGLELSTSPLDEVQVIAYGTTSKRLNTGNVSTVKAEDIQKQPVANPLAAIQGRMPGVLITQNTGMPGGSFTVQIRGQNSIQNGNDPLYIVDGVPYTSQLLSSLGPMAGGNPLNYLNPLDIESIDVLKDADATAIYGSRGANGVILITTKKGKAGKPQTDIHFYSGIGKVPKRLNWMNTDQYLQMRKEAFMNDGATPQPWDSDLTLFDSTRYTDYDKEFLGGSAQYLDARATVSGGSEFTQYTLGGGYHKETTVFPGSGVNQKGTMHIGVNTSSLDRRFRLSFSGNYTADFYNSPYADLTENLDLPPNAPEFVNPNGTLNFPPGIFNNPYSYMKRKFKNSTGNLIGNLVLSYNILNNLQLKTSVGYTNMHVDEFSADPMAAFNPLFGVLGSSFFINNNIRSWIAEPQINYDVHLGGGKLTALVGATVQQNRNMGQRLNATGYTSDALLENILAAADVVPVSSTNTEYRYNAVFGKLNYNYADKYLINVTARRDGSSKFGPGKQFANFGAVGAAWIFTNEPFFQSDVFSFGKLRASYGSTGNDQIPFYGYLDLYNPDLPYQGTPSLYPSALANPDLAWELTKKAEAGLEFGFLKNRILLSGSYYQNRSSSQLIAYRLSEVTGFNSITANFPATVQNAGAELSLNTINIQREGFAWTTSINLSIPRNKLVAFPDLATSSYGGPTGLIIGQPVNLVFGVYKYLGADPQTGQYLFEDHEGKPTLDPVDGVDNINHIDLNPKFYGGIQNAISFKNFELNFLFDFRKQTGANLYSSLRAPAGSSNYNQPVELTNRWQKPGDKADFPLAEQDYGSYNTFVKFIGSDFVYSDASFIRLKNLYISYRFPKSLIDGIKMQNASVFVQGQNLFTVTNYKGRSPEMQSSYRVPPLRVITAGFTISL